MDESLELKQRYATLWESVNNLSHYESAKLLALIYGSFQNCYDVKASKAFLDTLESLMKKYCQVKVTT